MQSRSSKHTWIIRSDGPQCWRHMAVIDQTVFLWGLTKFDTSSLELRPRIDTGKREEEFSAKDSNELSFHHQGFWIRASLPTALIFSTIAKIPILSLELKTSFRKLYIGSMAKSKKRSARAFMKNQRAGSRQRYHKRRWWSRMRNYENINGFSAVVTKSWTVTDSKNERHQELPYFQDSILGTQFSNAAFKIPRPAEIVAWAEIYSLRSQIWGAECYRGHWYIWTTSRVRR